MKKNVIYFLFLINFCMLTGCVSQDDYADLEKRVRYLESLHNISVNVEQNEINGEVLDKKDVLEQAEKNYVYNIDSLSTDEIVKECKYYFDNFPSIGLSFEDYLDSLKKEPVYIENNYNYKYYFYAPADKHITPPYDIISEITFDGIESEMDGSIGYYKWQPFICMKITLCINDYNRALELYDKLFKEVNTGIYSEFDDFREGTDWNIMGISAKYNLYNDLMNMYKRDDCYYITASYYVQNIKYEQ